MKGKTVLSAVLAAIMIITIAASAVAATDDGGCSITSTQEVQFTNDPLNNRIDNILTEGKSAFLFFYSDWCPYCHQETPIIDQLEAECEGEVAFIRINVTARPDHAEEFNVTALPAMIVISGKEAEGYVREEISGFTEETELSAIIAPGSGDEPDATADAVIRATPPRSTTCNSCEDCTDKLKSGEYDVVTLTTDITDHEGSCIVLIMGESNVVFDCGGHTIDGDDIAIDPEHGVTMMHGAGNTIKNCVISDFSDGIYLWDATDHGITGNTVISNDEGIEMGWSDSNTIDGNTVNENYNGIRISNSNSNTIDSNTVCKNTNSDFLIESGTGNSGDENICDRPDGWNDAGTTGCTDACSGTITCDSCSDCSDKLSGTYDTVMLTTDITNHAGTCIIFGASDLVFDCDGHRIDGDDSGTDYGIYMSGKSGNMIKNCVVTDFQHGIYLTGSTGNTIDKNTANSNTEDGIHLSSSSGNTIAHFNEANSNGRYGIFLGSSHNNQVSFNDANSNDGVGIRLSNSGSNTITFNDVLDNNNQYAWGIYLYRSDSNIVSSNYVTNNYYGVKLDNSHSNTFDANTVCSNPGTDFDVVGGSSGNSGDHNTCDEPDGWDDAGTTGCTHSCEIEETDLLIITPEEFLPTLRPLTDHKNATGMPTVLITLEQIYDSFDGSDKPEQIKHAIESYENNHKIKYVMLVGDVDKFPVRWVTYEEPNQPETQTLYFPSDLYYADLYGSDGASNNWNFDGDEYFGEHLVSDRWESDPYSVNADHADLHPDVAMGRVPASHIEEVESYVAKVIRYEYLTFDPTSDWFHNVLLLAGTSRPDSCDPGIHFDDTQTYLGDAFQYEIYIHESYYNATLDDKRNCECAPPGNLIACSCLRGFTDDQKAIFQDADGFLWPHSSEFVNIGFLGWHDHTHNWDDGRPIDYRTRVNNSDNFTVTFSDGCGDGSFTVVPPVEMVRHGRSYMETGGRIIQIIFNRSLEDRDEDEKNETYYDVIGCTIDGTRYSIDVLLTMFPDIILHDDFDDYGNPIDRTSQYILNAPPPAPLQPITSDREFNPEKLLFAKNSNSGVETGWVGLVAATKGASFTSNGELESLFFRSYNEPHSSVSDRNRLGNMWRSMLEYWLEEVVFDDTGNFDFTEYHDKYGGDISHKSSKVGIQSTMMFALFGDPSLRVGGVPILSDEIPPITTDDTDDDWHGADVTVTLTATDRGSPPSGVRMTVYRIDGGDWETGNHLTIEAPSDHSNDGIHTIDYYSVDFLGNREAEQSATVKIETVPPTTDILLDGETPATVVCPDDDPECESGCYNTRVDVTLDASDDSSGVAYTEYDLTGWPYSRYTEPFGILGGDYRDLITLRYWSVDTAGNAEWPPNEITFCVSNWRAGRIGDEVRILAALEEIVEFRMRKDFASTLPIETVKFEYAYQEYPKWTTIGVDYDGTGGWGVAWDTTKIRDGDYLIRSTVTGLPGRGMGEFEQDKVIYQEQINVTVCNIPNFSYKFKLSAPDEIERGEAIEYILTFTHKMDQTLTNLNVICDLDAGFFDKIAVLDNGYLNQEGNPSWYIKELKEGERWNVHFKGWTKHDIPTGTVITSQALITADAVPILLSDDPTTPSKDDYTAVAIRLVNGLITGRVLDAKYGTPIMASVAIDGSVTQSVATDVNGTYSFSDLLPGVYNVSVNAENYNYHSPDGHVTVTLNGTGANMQADFFMILKDAIPPVSSILLSADEIVQESMTEMYGTAYDYAPGSGVSKVELSIEQNNDRRYWDGDSWEDEETWLMTSGTTEWTFNCTGITWDSDFSYAMKSRATDNAGNVERPTVIATTSALGSPMLIAPANNTIADVIPTFEWSYVLDSRYYLQIDNDSDFQSPEVNVLDLTYNTHTIGEIGEGTYYWRVKAIDVQGHPESDWSEVWTVNIALNTATCDSCSDCTKKLNGDYDTVVLTTDLTNAKGSCITFGADNVVFDGGGHKIDGDDEGDIESGIMMNGKSGNTIKNCVITDFESGITLYGSSKNEICKNKISSNYYDGVWISEESNSNNIHDNVIEDNGNYGVFFSSNSNGNTFSGNAVCSNPTDIQDEAKNSGDENVCDTTDNWNDAGTQGCTHDCASRKPDLVITDIRNEDGTICYEIKNIGDATASEGHYTTLFVDGLYQIKEQVDVDLAPGASVERCFDYYTWNCTSPADTVEVCADYGDFVDESDEENNCLNVTWGCTSPASPGGAIIYHADYGAGIWRIESDGSENTQLSDHGWFAEYSPDNAKIAFGEYYQNGIWVMNADGTGQVQLTSSGNAPTWSPDGTRIAYHVGGTKVTDRRIWVMGADGSNAHKLSDSPGDFPAWSPDGTKIAYYGEVDKDIRLINPDGTGDTQLCAEGAFPAWSPDGRKIAYRYGCIWTMDADGSGNVKISANAGKHPAWSPDGTKIAYEGTTGIWVIDADGTDEHLINQGGHAPDWMSPGIVGELPDLVITDVWNEDGGICYQIRNIGETTAPKGHYSFLLIDGIEAAGDPIGVELGPGGRLKRCFNYGWQCSPPDDAVTVCADHRGVVDEADEGNNCRNETWKCDNTPPVIVLGPVVSGITPSSVTISWTTDEDGDSLVRFGRTAGKYADQKSGMKMKQEHKIILADLLPSTTYHYLVESRDASDNTVVGNEGFFGTGALPDDVKPDVTFFAITKRSLPPEFTALATDNVGVDRVEFYCDGEYVETDYSTPYRFYLDPAYMGMTRAEYFTDHTIEAIAFDSGGMICVAATAFLPHLVCDPPTEWFFRMPYEGYMVSTSSNVAEEGTIIDIDVDASTTEWTYGHVLGHPDIETVQGTAVDRMEFWVDGTRVYNSTADTTYHSYDWDASGISLGDHTVLVKAFYDDCVYSESHTFRVVRPMPEIEVSRTVRRNDNFFTVSVYIENLAEDINEVAIIDNFIYHNSIDHGLQVIDKNGYNLVLNSNYSTRGKHCENEITLESPLHRLWPGESMGITYSAVPILYPGDAAYGLSEVTIEIDYHDAYGNPHNETFFLPAEDGGHFASLVDDATGDSDYLIVTNPARLFSHYTDADVEDLLSSMASLAEEKNGALGYLDTHSRSAFKDLIEPGGDWSSRLATDWTSEGYLLLVGETEIIGSWELNDDDINIGNRRGTVHYSDLPYANTVGEWKTLELIVGRIIGNDASELIIPIQTSINVHNGEPGFEFDRSYALAVSGGGKGANAFERNVDDVAAILDDEFSVRKLKKRDIDDAGGDINAEFKAHDANRDVIFFRDHGGPTTWTGVIGTSDFRGSNPVDFENSKPFAFACCCKAGRYEGDGEYGIAEAFLQHGTAVYIGSTEISERYRNNVATKKFFEEWVGSSYSVGRAFRNFKGDFNSRKGRRYWIAEYNLYGDPKYGAASAAITVAGAASTPKMAASEPQRSLEIVIPDYEVTTTEESEHHVEIPGGDMILELDKPMVPFYTANLDYPVGCRVQDVILTDRSGMTTETGLNIPDETMEWDSATVGILSSTSEEEWWPEEVFEWNVRENPDGTSTLIIVMYPFYYNQLTTDVEFYKNYKFEIIYTTSNVEIAALTTDADVYQQGDDIIVDLWLNNSGDANDVLVDAVVKAGSSGEIVGGLLLHTLQEFEGIASFSPRWDSDGFEPGYYFVEVTMKDTSGEVLNRKTEMFRLGISSGEIASFTATPECFDIGDEIGIAMAFENNGTVNITGTAIIRVLNSTGGTAYEFRHNVTNLTPSGSVSFSDAWDTSEVEVGSSYEIIGYVLYDSKSSDPATVTVQNMIMGDAIIFHADYGAGIWRMNPDGSENTQLSDHGWFAEYSPDNSKIAFGEYYQNGIWVMDSDGTDQVQLTSSGGAPTWSPDGTMIAYCVGGTTETF